MLQENINTIKINSDIIKIIRDATKIALKYESATKNKRKLGITGEVGELLACYELGLKLAVDPRAKGFDAVDREGHLIQIKTRRSEHDELPKDSGRTGRFSKHKFDYALLVILNKKYGLKEIWKADYYKLSPLINKAKRRDPNLRAFKKIAKRVFPK